MTIPLSALASRIQPSATLAAGARAKELKAAGKRIYDFCLGEPDFPTPEHIRAAAVRAMQQGFTKYTPANGIPELRAAVARQYHRLYGLVYSPEQVLISNGAKHALHNALTTLVQAGDEVLLPAPYWVSYRDIIDMTGARMVPIPTEEARRFKLQPEQLRAAVTPRARVLLLNSPCNPTGTVYTASELSALAEVVLETGLAVVSDEIYERLTYGGVPHACFAACHPDVKERTITISGASKSFAMTGWRMGWAAGPEPIIRAMGNIQSQQAGCPGSISQYAALAGLEGDQGCIEQMRREFEARRDLVVRRLGAMPGVTCPQGDGAFYAFFRVAGHFGRIFAGRRVDNSAEFCQVLLDEYGVNVVPGSAFGAEGYVRLSFASSREELAAGLDQLERMLQSP